MSECGGDCFARVAGVMQRANLTIGSGHRNKNQKNPADKSPDFLSDKKVKKIWKNIRLNQLLLLVIKLCT